MVLFKRPLVVEQINTPLLTVIKMFFDHIEEFSSEDRSKLIDIFHKLSGQKDKVEIASDKDIRLDLDKK